MFSKVVVIGAGTMGAGIAGQVANSGVDVLLLDLPSDGDDVNAVARRGLERLKDPDQPGLMTDSVAERITLGNIRDDLHHVKDADWVAEAVVERLDIKHRLYAEIEKLISDTGILTSNTSTIPIRLLTQKMAANLRQRFAITHFFNPVRFMRLLELVKGEDSDTDVVAKLSEFCEKNLGKGVVNCADTPGFLANRVGCFAIQTALHEAFKMQLAAPVADALFGRPMGIPKTGVFGLYDLIGIDLMSDVAKSLVSILPDGDAFHAVSEPIPFMTDMIANDQRGNKSGQGFYRTLDTGERQVISFEDGQYHDFDRPQIDIASLAEQDGINHLIKDNSIHGQYAWKVLSETLCYAASLIPEVGDDPAAIDDAMKLGYNWISGPFELLDEIGLDYFVARLNTERRSIPSFIQRAVDDSHSTFYRVSENTYQRRLWAQDESSSSIWKTIDHGAGVTRFSQIRHILKPEMRNESASWYQYHECAVVEFHTKANALDGESMTILNDALQRSSQMGLKGVVVHNDAQHFSCGVNLGAVRGFYESADFDGLDRFLDHFQQTVHAMAVADFPVVAAPVGMSIGGGFEVVLHAQHVIAHANSVTGLVESLVGLVPAGGGCKETLYRWVEKLGCPSTDISEASWKAFMNLGYGKTATSPDQSKKQAMLRDSDVYLMNRDRMLSEAIRCVHQAQGLIKADRPALSMPGREVFQAMSDWLDKAKDKGMITQHDTVVGKQIAEIVSGGDIDAGTLWTEQDLYDAERRAFLRLTKTAETPARIASMLDLGQTLRN